MELKVWVEGIQRIVCGVNEKTTCQDVVFALAHATGKTGRFTLIERWRNSERLLAPSEQPLKVLLKWGEHSNDVQFILQWSPLESGATGSNRTGQFPAAPVGKSHLQGAIESSCSDNSLSHSPTPLSKPTQYPFPVSTLTSGGVSGGGSPLPKTNGPATTTKNVTKSGSSSSYTSNDSRLWNAHFSQNGPLNGSPSAMHPSDGSASTLRNGDIRSPSSSSASPGGGIIRTAGPLTQRPPQTDHIFSSSPGNRPSDISGPGAKQLVSSPPPYREPPSPSNSSHNPTPPLSSPQTGNVMGSKSLPPYREPPPPNLANTAGSVSNFPSTTNKTISNRGSPSTSMSGASSTSRNVTAVFNGNGGSGSNSKNLNGVANGGSGFGVSNQKEFVKHSSNAQSLGPAQQDSSLSSGINSRDVDSWKIKDRSLTNGDNSSSNQNGPNNPSKVSPAPPPPVPQSYSSNSNSNYREIIRVVNSQREKLTSQQAELTQYDAEIMFWEGKSKEQQKHMDLINKEIARLEVVSAQHESQTLSLAHLEEESEHTERESLALKSEIKSLRTDLDKCDEEIDQCKQRIRNLMEELHLTQHQMNQRQQESLEKEASTKSEIDKLRNELEITQIETEAATELSGSLDHEVDCIETSLTEKKKQMEQLVAAMKEANLQSLSIQPPEDLIEVVHHRSGSTRRMIGSPRQLENAAPTTKNPHGVWV